MQEMTKVVLVGVDETSESQIALRWAVDVARAGGMAVRVVRAYLPQVSQWPAIGAEGYIPATPVDQYQAPGLQSKKIWLTPDRYASGPETRAKLALNKTPDGYFEIPMCRVQCPSAPGRVQPYYGQPGGGTEITTEFGIDIRGLIFRTFE